MSAGISLALLSALLFSANNLLGKFVSGTWGLRASLLVQYAFMAAFGAVALALFGSFAIAPGPMGWAVLAGCGAVGYAGVACLLLALRRAPVAVVLCVAYSYVFFGYLANVALFPERESLSWARLALGTAFFAAVAAFLFERDAATGRLRLGAAALLPVATALCWAAYFSASNWLLRAAALTDLQVTFWTEGAVLAVAAMAYVGTRAWRRPVARAPAAHGAWARLAYLGWALSMYGGVLTLNMAFARAPANLVNFVGLSSLVLAPALAYVFLGERLTRVQTATAAVAAALLGAFVLAG